MQFLYFDLFHAIFVHDEIIRKSGGLLGINDEGLLLGVLAHIQNDIYYPTLVDKVTHLCFSVNKNHAFADGNKRASIALSGYLLTVNGYFNCVSRFILEMENIAVDVADNRIQKELLHDIIHAILNYDEFDEDLLLRIIDAKGL